MNKILNLLLLVLSINKLQVTDAFALNASTLASYGYDNTTEDIIINDSMNSIQDDDKRITDIDPNAFKGYTKLKSIKFIWTWFQTIDLEMFNYATSLRTLSFESNPNLTNITNKNKIKLSSLQELDIFFDTPLKLLDANAINGLPNLIKYSWLNSDSRYKSLKPNELAPLKKLQYLAISTINQTSLTKSHFNGLSSLSYLSFHSSDITKVDANTFSGMSNLSYLNLGLNSIRSFEYLQIPKTLETIDLYTNNLNYFKLSRTMSAVKKTRSQQQ